MRLRHVLAAMLLLVPVAARAQQYPYAFQPLPLVIGTTAGTAGDGGVLAAVQATANAAAPLNSPAITGNPSITPFNMGQSVGGKVALYGGVNAQNGYGLGINASELGLYTAGAVSFRDSTTSAGMSGPIFFSSSLAGTTIPRHLIGTGGATPTVSAGSLSTGASDLRGYIVLASSVTSTTLTFATAYATTPYCVVTGSSTAINLAITTGSNTAVTIALSANPSGEYVNYQCIQ